jgi:zinc/manganese transport system substrate-binding protein
MRWCVGWVSAPGLFRLLPGRSFARNPTSCRARCVGLRANEPLGMIRKVRGALTQPTALALAAAILLPSPALARPLKIVATFSILADLVHEVAGPHADVTALIGPGGDTHTFDPSPSDAAAIADADLIVVNGLGLDDWMKRLAKPAGFAGTLVVASDDVTPRVLGEGVADPHAWQDPRNGALYVRAIEFALAKADVAHTADFLASADKLTAALEALDEETRKTLSSIPVERRKLITSHDAFGYFGRAYGVEVLAAAGISTGQEPSAGAIARLIDQIRAEHIGTVFVEAMADPRLGQTIRSETGAQDGGTLYADTLSAPDGPAPGYLAMMRYNIAKLIAAMRGTVP